MNLRKSEIRFMRHLITKNGLKPDPDKVKAVEEMPKPQSKKELLSLLGFVNYSSKVAQTLRDLTAKEAKLIWSKQHKEAFKAVGKLIVKHLVLNYYDLEEEVTVQDPCHGLRNNMLRLKRNV